MTVDQPAAPATGDQAKPTTGLRRRLAAIIATLAATAAVMLGAAGTANAGGSFIYTQPGQPQAYAYCSWGCTPGAFPVGNWTSSPMQCWGDWPSGRYFVVSLPGRPGGYAVRAQYVYSQTGVRHC